MSDKPKLCPILTAPSSPNEPCLEEQCEWWSEHYNHCAVVVLAITLSTPRYIVAGRNPEIKID